MNHRKSPIFRITVILCAILALTTITVLAYLSTTTGSLENIFKPAEQKDPVIQEGADGNSFDGIIKTDVKVNVGNPGYAVYVRAVIVVNWEKDGTNGEDTNNFHAIKPVLGTDYELVLDDTGAWFKEGDFYYHKAMVTDDTAVLIESCSPIADKAPDGYHLDVQIVSQTIQALGTTDADGKPAVTDTWKIEVENQQLVDPNP